MISIFLKGRGPDKKVQKSGLDFFLHFYVRKNCTTFVIRCMRYYQLNSRALSRQFGIGNGDNSSVKNENDKFNCRVLNLYASVLF